MWYSRLRMPKSITIWKRSGQKTDLLSANQLLAALVLIALAVFLKTTGRTGWTLYIPMFAMLAVTFTALIQKTIALVKNIAGGQATFLVDGLQFIVAVLLMVLGVLVAFSCLKKLFGKSSAGQAA